MPKITYRHADGTQDSLDISPGISVMQGAISGGVKGIVAECGGAAMCATCHVYVDQKWLAALPPMNAVEHEMLETTAAERRPNSRLSCQIKVGPDLDGLVVGIPDRQL